jgi:hypothetical protein
MDSVLNYIEDLTLLTMGAVDNFQMPCLIVLHFNVLRTKIRLALL